MIFHLVPLVAAGLLGKDEVKKTKAVLNGRSQCHKVEGGDQYFTDENQKITVKMATSIAT